MSSNIKDKIREIAASGLSDEEKLAKIKALVLSNNGQGKSASGVGQGTSNTNVNGGSSDSGEAGEGNNGDGPDSGGEGQGKGHGGSESGKDGEGQGQDGSEGGNSASGKSGSGSGSGDNGDGGESGEGSGSGDKEGEDGQGLGKSGSGSGGKSGEDGQGSGSGEGDGEGEGEDGQGQGSGSGQGQSGSKGQSGSGDNGDGGESGEGSDGEPGDNSGQNGQNQNGQNNQSNNQGQGNSQSQQQQNQGQGNSQQQNQQQGGGKSNKDAVEDMLKNMDLSKKMRNPGGASSDDDSISVEGLPLEDDGNQPQQPGGGNNEEFDAYLAGKYLGIAYAKEVYRNKGFKPAYGYLYDIPDVPDMKILESLTESVDDDIITALRSGKGTDEIVDDIYNIMFPMPEIPEEIIPLENGVIDKDDLMGSDDHIISKQDGERIRKNINDSKAKVQKDVKLIDPDWGLSDDPSDILPSIGKMMERAKRFAKTPAQKEAVEKMERGIGIRIKKNRDGIINWKHALEDFILTTSNNTAKGPLRRNVYYKTGIGAKRTVQLQDSLNKVVIYVDTSASVNNSETQLIPLMASEIVKIAEDCEVREFDVHLFTTSVYSQNFGVTKQTVLSDNFGLNDVRDGGTNINQVYNHILENYIEDGNLDPEVSCIIIITDLAVEDYDIHPIADEFGEVLEKMLYVIYDNYNTQGISRAEIEEEIREYISNKSTLMVINTRDFQKNFGYKNMKESYTTRVNEAIGRKEDLLAKKQAQQQGLDDERRDKVLRIGKIQGARENGTLDELYPEIFATIEKFFPDWKVVKDYAMLEEKTGTFYIDDEERIIVHDDFNKGNINNLFKLCDSITIYKIIGNINLKGAYSVTSFPASFPKILQGDLLLMLGNIKDYTNLPTQGILKFNCDRINMSRDSRRTFDEWFTVAGPNIKQPLGLSDLMKNLFGDSTTNEAYSRYELGLKYLTEAKDSNFVGSLLRPAALRNRKSGEAGLDADTYNRLMDVYDNNRMIFREVVLPLLPVDWGTFKEKRGEGGRIENVEFLDNRRQVLSQFVSDQGTGSGGGKKKFYGIYLCMSKDDRISLVYAKPKESNDGYILAFRGEDGSIISDQKEIAEDFKRRNQVYVDHVNMFKKLGLDSDILPNKTEALGPATVKIMLLGVLYFALAKLNGTPHKSRQMVDILLNRTGMVNGVDMSNATDQQFIDSVLSGIFGGKASKVSTGTEGSYTVTYNGGSKYNDNLSINLDATSSGYTGYRSIFVESAYHSLERLQNNGTPFDLASVFSMDFLYNILVGISIRDNYDDGTTIYPYDVVKKAYENDDEAEIDKMITDCLDVDINVTFLKNRQHTSPANPSKNTNPYTVIHLYPGVAEKAIWIKINVEEEAVRSLLKKVNRKVSRVGMRDDILTGYDYDVETGVDAEGRQYRKKVYDTSSPKIIPGSETLKKTESDFGIADMFSRISEGVKQFEKDATSSIKIVKESVSISSNRKGEYANEYKDAINRINSYISVLERFVHTELGDERIADIEFAEDYVDYSETELQKKFSGEKLATVKKAIKVRKGLEGVIELFYNTYTELIQNGILELGKDVENNAYEILKLSDQVIDNANAIEKAYEDATEINASTDAGKREINRVKRETRERSGYSRRIPVPDVDDNLTETLDKLEKLYGIFYVTLDRIYDADEFYAERARYSDKSGNGSYVTAVSRVGAEQNKGDFVNNIADSVDTAIDAGRDKVKSDPRVNFGGSFQGIIDDYRTLAQSVYEFITEAPEARNTDADELEVAFKKAIEIFQLASKLTGAVSTNSASATSKSVNNVAALYKEYIAKTALMDEPSVKAALKRGFNVNTKIELINMLKDKFDEILSSCQNVELPSDITEMLDDLSVEMQTAIDFVNDNVGNLNINLCKQAGKVNMILNDILDAIEEAGISSAAAASGAISG